MSQFVKPVGGQSLQGILEVLNKKGAFMASVLTDSDGLPLAAVTHGESELAEVLAAVEPFNRAVLVYDAPTHAQRLNESDTLKGEGILAEFAMPIADIFEW